MNNLETIELETVKLIFASYEPKRCLAFVGGKKQRQLNMKLYRFDSRNDAISYVEKINARKLEAKAARKAQLAEEHKQQKARAQEFIKTIKAGDLFHRSWGYDETRNDFYQVIEVFEATGKVAIRKVGAKASDWQRDGSKRLTPVQNDFIGNLIVAKLKGEWLYFDDKSASKCSWGGSYHDSSGTR